MLSPMFKRMAALALRDWIGIMEKRLETGESLPMQWTEMDLLTIEEAATALEADAAP